MESPPTFMVYGSFVRSDFVPGRSDIDAVLVFHNDVVIDKEKFNLVSRVLRDALLKHFVPFQVTPCDIAIMKDGRFNAYGPHFHEYFAREGRILIGNDIRKDIHYEVPSMDEQGPLTFNLRKSRHGLLFAEYDMCKEPELFISRFKKTLDAASRASKQVFHMNGFHALPDRFAGLELLVHEFPNLDIALLRRIKHLYTHLDELYALYHKPEEVLKLWNESVTFFERLVLEYIRKNPRK